MNTAPLATGELVFHLLRCFVVTGGIVAPVTRCRLVRYVKTFSEHRCGRWVLAAIAFADSSFLPTPPGSSRRHFPADPKGGIAPPELLDKISPMPVDIKGERAHALRRIWRRAATSIE